MDEEARVTRMVAPSDGGPGGGDRGGDGSVSLGRGECVLSVRPS